MSILQVARSVEASSVVLRVFGVMFVDPAVKVWSGGWPRRPHSRQCFITCARVHVFSWLHVNLYLILRVGSRTRSSGWH